MTERHHRPHRLGDLSFEQYQAALDRFDLGTFLRAEPIMAGISKRNTFVTSTKGVYVLRGNSQFPWQYPTEQYFACQLHAQTHVPVPYPYLVDLSTDIFGWSYAMMPRMAGLQLSDRIVRACLGKEEKPGIARAMGETLAQLQDLTAPCAGRYDCCTETIRPFELSQELSWPFPPEQDETGRQEERRISYSERIISRMRHLLACAASCNQHTTAADIAWVEQTIARNEEALRVPFQPCFLMEDFKEQNVVVRRESRRWRVSGVFDLTHAHYGDGEADLSRLFAMYLDEDPALAYTFLDAYRANRPPRPGFNERFALYMLHDRLQLWEFFQRLGHDYPWPEALTLQQWTAFYLS